MNTILMAAGVSVEPVAFAVGRQTHGGDTGKYLEWNRGTTPKSVGEEAEPLYTADAIAAARVQENERCARTLEAIGCQGYADALRALLGKEQS